MNAGLWTVAGMFAALAVGLICMALKEHYYEQGFWAGRSSGWKASLEHQQKLQHQPTQKLQRQQKAASTFPLTNFTLLFSRLFF